MVKAFYGKRTVTSFYLLYFDALLRVNLQFSEEYSLKNPVERAIIRVSGDDAWSSSMMNIRKDAL